jgi:REP element-mobilizing transposase RayT
VHVTLRLRPEVYQLRSQRCFSRIYRAFAAACERPGVRLCRFSVQRDHLHLIIEATDAGALGRAMRSLVPRIAKGLNTVMRRRGRVVSDRYHLHVLRTPAETRNAVVYVRENGAKHLRQDGCRVPTGWRDPFSSEADRFAADLLAHGRPVAEARTWLLATALARAG